MSLTRDIAAIVEFAEVRRLPTNTPQKTLDRIYRQYADAMQRRRPDGVRGDFLKDVWRENGAQFVRKGKNFILGRTAGGTFIPTHFAPHSLRGGAELVKEVRDSVPSAFAVTPDLGAQLKKAQFKKVPDFLAKKVVGPEKEVWTNSYAATARAAATGGVDEMPALPPAANPRFRKGPKGPAYTNPRPARIGDVWPKHLSDVRTIVEFAAGLTSSRSA
jgi:hypothetical protein